MYRICYCIFLLLSFLPSFAQNTESSLIPFQADNGQFGYKNTGQQVVIEAQYEEASPFTGNYAFAKKDNLWGLINTKGKWIIPAAYEDIGWTYAKNKSPILNGEILGYKHQGKWGLISLKNKVIMPPRYNTLQPFATDKIKAGQISSASEADTLYGIIDTQGKEIIPLQYHSLEPTHKESILLAGLNKIYAYTASGQIQSSLRAYGLINWTNTAILSIQYKKVHSNKQEYNIIPFHSWKLIADKDSALAMYALDTIYAIGSDKYAFINAGKAGLLDPLPVLHANKDAIAPEQKGLILYKSGKKYGVLVNEGSASPVHFLPAIYDTVVVDTPEFIRRGILEQNAWKWEVSKRDNNKNTTLTSHTYSWIEEISSHPLVKVKSNRLYGYINKQGTEVIPVQYDSLGGFMDSVCVAVYKGKYGILTHNGKWIFEPKADYFAVNRLGYFIRKQNGRYEVTDKSGKVKYISAEPIQFLPDGSIPLKQKGKTGRISPTGISCVPAAYDSIYPMTPDRTFWAYAGKNIFLYKDNGELLVKPGSGIEKIMYELGHEFLPVRISGKYGFVDGFGRLRIANQYEEVRPFDADLAAVKLAGKWGFVTKQEKIAVQPYYDELGAFENGKAIARKGDKYGIIDNKGKVVTPFSFDKIMAHPTGNYVTETKGRQGMINKKGFEVVYTKYDQVLPQEDNKAIIKVQDKYGLLDAKGVAVLPAAYDKILKNPFSDTYLVYQKAMPFTINDQQIETKAAARHK
jgi:hypothetical protein